MGARTRKTSLDRWRNAQSSEGHRDSGIHGRGCDDSGTGAVAKFAVSRTILLSNSCLVRPVWHRTPCSTGCSLGLLSLRFDAFRVTFLCTFVNRARRAILSCPGGRSALSFVVKVLLLSTLFVSALAAIGTTPEEAHFPADAVAFYERVSRVAAPAGADAIILNDEETFVFDAQGRVVRSRYVAYKVLTQEGAEGWDDIALSWEPWHEERPTLRARVITSRRRGASSRRKHDHRCPSQRNRKPCLQQSAGYAGAAARHRARISLSRKRQTSPGDRPIFRSGYGGTVLFRSVRTDATYSSGVRCSFNTSPSL